MKNIALTAIKLYQRFISPYKGFSCAYRAHTGRAGCSALGYRAISRFGFWQGLPILRQRLLLCADTHKRCSGISTLARRQAGFCDVPCDIPCDAHCGAPDISHDCQLLTKVADCPACDCLDCWPSRDKTLPRRRNNAQR